MVWMLEHSGINYNIYHKEEFIHNHPLGLTISLYNTGSWSFHIDSPSGTMLTATSELVTTEKLGHHQRLWLWQQPPHRLE